MTETATGASNDVVTQPQQPTPPIPQKFKVPVDGSEVEVDLDELKRGYSHARAANQRMQEAAKIRKAEEQRRQRALQGDFGWVDELGITKDQVLGWAEKEFLKKIEFEQLPPHEQQLRKERQQREELEQQLREMSNRERQAVEAQILERASAEVDEEISKVLQSYQGKKTPRLIRRIAEAMYANLEKTGASLPSTKALEIAQKSLREDLNEFLSVSSPEDLVKSMSKEQLAALRKYFVEEARSQAPFARSSSASQEPAPTRGRKRMNTDDYFKTLEKKFGR